MSDYATPTARDFSIPPGTETCLKVGGYLRFELAGGDNVYTGGYVGGDNDTWYVRTRAEVRFDARSETELGTLRSMIDTRFQNTNGNDARGTLHQTVTELGGFQIGVNDVLFGSWLGCAGNIIRDDVITVTAEKHRLTRTLMPYTTVSYYCP
jgi:hypothetical protein